ncbi:MAG: alpha/beta fold hydrolase [Chloroflexaceae bacterium]|jgi:carboxylesterase|nr:alpha/beta fold hydrolase [Chloroflexaceae bacterium]
MQRAEDEPFLFSGDEHGCLLVHGFSGSPTEMRGLGEHLHRQGRTVLGVRLAGHGSTPEALAQVRWRDWYETVEKGYIKLRHSCRNVSVVGFSLGGALAIQLARHKPMQRLVLLSTLLSIQGDWRINLLGLVRHFKPWFYPMEKASFDDPFVRQRVREFDPTVNLDDPEVQEFIRRSIKISVGAIDEMRQALIQTRADLPHVQRPVLVMHGREDEVAASSNAEEIVSRIGSQKKELVWWERTGHQMLVVGPHREAIYERVATFVGGELARTV